MPISGLLLNQGTSKDKMNNEQRQENFGQFFVMKQSAGA
jgi:hypothetical protein